jgi:hypothetical protein
MYERKTEKFLTRAQFRKRVLKHFLIALYLVVGALSIGVLGYYITEPKLGWLDALLNASMILGGMGPVDHVDKPAAKIFASFYALFSGIMFITVASVLTAPFAHRLIHYFHLPDTTKK